MVSKDHWGNSAFETAESLPQITTAVGGREGIVGGGTRYSAVRDRQ